jgi:DNA uptake protein ComE-like DNA-binding protein
VKLVTTTGEKTRVTMASAIDLAGSEDNRRTENGKERMVESASINKSLFVLAQCVEAISKKQSRIPYRESKMTRILSLGQNNGLTLMILNLASVRSYHLDTISSLNFANRTKKIEIREIENEPMFKGPARPLTRASTTGGALRQPLRPLTSSVNVKVNVENPSTSDEKKPAKAFFVYSDKQSLKPHTPSLKSDRPRRSSPLKRNSDVSTRLPSRIPRESDRSSSKAHGDIPADRIEEMVERKVEQILAARAMDDSSKQQAQMEHINEEVQRRLELLERKIEGTEDARAEGLSYLLMAKQHHGRGEYSSALRMYRLALPFFPRNEKLAAKIAALEEKLNPQPQVTAEVQVAGRGSILSIKKPAKMARTHAAIDENYKIFEHEDEDDYDDSYIGLKRKRAMATPKMAVLKDDNTFADENAIPDRIQSPRTSHLLSVINSRDVGQIKLLKGVGAKKAEAIVDCLCEMGEVDQVRSLSELGRLKGVGLKTVQNMRSGVFV